MIGDASFENNQNCAGLICRFSRADFGCSRLYNNGTEESGTNGATISAEEYPVEETAATEVTPSSDKELSLTESSSISFTFLGDCLLSTNAGDTRTDTFAKYAEKCDPSYFFEKAVPYYSNSDFVIANNEFVLSDRNLSKSKRAEPHSGSGRPHHTPIF